MAGIPMAPGVHSGYREEPVGADSKAEERDGRRPIHGKGSGTWSDTLKPSVSRKLADQLTKSENKSKHLLNRKRD